MRKSVIRKVLPGDRVTRPLPPGAGTVQATAGLTLIEVLVALFIFGVGVAVIFQGLALGLKVRRGADESQRLSLVALNRISLMMADGAVSQGQEEGSTGDYSWRIESSPYGGESDHTDSGGLEEVRITVESPSGRTWETVSLFPVEEDEP
jgi:prepilin-type N-terminal cleavage/methylation domain-containing protein